MPLKNKKLAANKKSQTKPVGKDKIKAGSKAVVKKKVPTKTNPLKKKPVAKKVVAPKNPSALKAKATKTAKIVKPTKKIVKKTPQETTEVAAKKTTQTTKKLAPNKKTQKSLPKVKLSKINAAVKKTTDKLTKQVPAKNKKVPIVKTNQPPLEKNILKNLKNITPQNKQFSKTQTEPEKIAKPAARTTMTEGKAHKLQAQPNHTKKRTRSALGPVGFSPYNTKSDEVYMNEVQLKHFQHILNLWKQQLVAGRDVVASQMRDDTINFPDPLDRAALEEEHTLEWRAREREHRLIMKIDQALAHIKQGEYGYCESCGAEIGIERLEARPTATQCIDCKTINELRERHTGILE